MGDGKKAAPRTPKGSDWKGGGLQNWGSIVNGLRVVRFVCFQESLYKSARYHSRQKVFSASPLLAQPEGPQPTPLADIY